MEKKITVNYENTHTFERCWDLTDEEIEQMNNSDYISPIYEVKKIPIELIKANNYNPNAMDKNIFELLHTSMIESGWTLPCVVAPNNDDDKDKYPYVLVDGFHRVLIMSLYKDIYIREKGVVPCVVLNKDQNRYDRMFATILHNRCKGTHDIDIMSNIITELVSSGLSDYEIQKRLGMDKEELLRLKQLTGLASLFADKEFSKSWKFEE